MTRPQTVVEAKPCKVCKQYPMLEADNAEMLHEKGYRVHCHDWAAGVTRDDAVRSWNEMQESR